MIDLRPLIERLQALLDENTEQSVTYAALEARLALEKIAYDRLRQCHDYISHEQLKRWQPHAVVNKLLAEVDGHAIHTRTLLMSRTEAVPGVEPDDDDFVEIGTEIGFDPKRVGQLWNALSGLALHVKLPKNKHDHIPKYGDVARIRSKVEETVQELERVAKGTMSFSGIGEEVSFACRCGESNRRRASLLREGQSVFCINPDCMASWTTAKKGDEYTFESETVDVACSECGELNLLDRRHILAMKFDQTASLNCQDCGVRNYVRWQLVQARQVEPVAAPTSDDGTPVPVGSP